MRTHGNTQKHESSNPIQRRLIDSFHEQVVAFLRQAQPECILEVGCGEGYVLSAVQRAGIDARVMGVDLSAAAIGAARGRVEQSAELHVMDARDVVGTVLERAADVVMLLEVLEHLEDPERMLDDLTSLTSSYVLLSVPREPFFRGMNLLRLKNVRDLGNDPEHINHWGARAFIDLVDTRFEVVATARPFPWTMVLGHLR